MLINLHGHLERPLDIRDRTADIQHQAIGSRMRHRQTVRSGEGCDPFVIVCGWPKSLRELLHRQEMAVIGTGGVVEIVQKAWSSSWLRNRSVRARLNCFEPGRRPTAFIPAGADNRVGSACSCCPRRGTAMNRVVAASAAKSNDRKRNTSPGRHLSFSPFRPWCNRLGFSTALGAVRWRFASRPKGVEGLPCRTARSAHEQSSRLPMPPLHLDPRSKASTIRRHSDDFKRVARGRRSWPSSAARLQPSKWRGKIIASWSQVPADERPGGQESEQSHAR